MRAMILAAGRGERMRPLTDRTPKPLLSVGDKPLIIWHIERLARAGFRDIVINIAWQGWQIPATLGNGSRWGVNLHYSDEQTEGALETAGGIIKALPLLTDDGEPTFLVVNGDVWTDHPCLPRPLIAGKLAHLVLAPNPPQHPQGDFALEQGKVMDTGEPRHTFSGIGYYRRELFLGLGYGKRPLAPLLRQAMQQQQVSGELFMGDWQDIGTPERLAALNATLAASATRKPQN